MLSLHPDSHWPSLHFMVLPRFTPYSVFSFLHLPPTTLFTLLTHTHFFVDASTAPLTFLGHLPVSGLHILYISGFVHLFY
ncbi:hypothetical protein BOTBODRAFT_583771 [Botryobasidium botryosum FD-172 SS1]|uniref:Uncharacterized protein n=1 Tax=Botryobasidium botryosum (strain FD-172 SS1) TaxID=930990 RepID=A0A067N130_BOTB1|nr:hypothetical protein BOTBODRAFT_583771 [Botryobasidium botryosum FD-172 SS1]